MPAADYTSSATVRSAARLAAVQALYLIASTDAEKGKVIKDFLSGRLGGIAIEEDSDKETETQVRLSDFDEVLFTDIVSTAVSRQADIDPLIDNNLSDAWPKNRLEITLRSILRAALAELLGSNDVPGNVVISEYVEVAHAFYSEQEPKLVNALLDKVVKVLYGPKLSAS